MTLKILCAILLFHVSNVSTYPSNQYHAKETNEHAKPYAFSYGVIDRYRGTDFERNEKSDGSVVIGSYSVQLPDGRKQTVTYEADHNNGFVADVSYDGVAKYPPPSKEPPFVVLPSQYSSSIQELPNLHKVQSINYQESPSSVQEHPDSQEIQQITLHDQPTSFRQGYDNLHQVRTNIQHDQHLLSQQYSDSHEVQSSIYKQPISMKQEHHNPHPVQANVEHDQHLSSQQYSDSHKFQPIIHNQPISLKQEHHNLHPVQTNVEHGQHLSSQQYSDSHEFQPVVHNDQNIFLKQEYDNPHTLHTNNEHGQYLSSQHHMDSHEIKQTIHQISSQEQYYPHQVQSTIHNDQPLSPQQDHLEPHQIEPVTLLDQHFSSQPIYLGSSEDSHSVNIPEISTYSESQEHIDIQHQPLHQQENIHPTIIKPKLVLHDANVNILDSGNSFHYQNNPSISSPGEKDSSYSVPTSHSENSFDQPTFNQKQTFTKEDIPIHVPNIPDNIQYQLLSNQHSEDLGTVPKSTYSEHIDSTEQEFFNENLVTIAQPTPLKNTQNLYNEIKLPFKNGNSYNLSNDDLFIPNYINPSIPKINPEFYQLLSSSYNPATSFQSSQFLEELIPQNPIPNSNNKYVPPESNSNNLIQYQTVQDEILKNLNHQNHPSSPNHSNLLTDDPNKQRESAFVNQLNHPPIYIPNVTQEPLLKVGVLFTPEQIYEQQQSLTQFKENIPTALQGVSNEHTRQQYPHIQTN